MFQTAPGIGAKSIVKLCVGHRNSNGGWGSLEEAERTFAELITYANDVGLFAEEIDPVTGAALGNFPQAFTHVGLITARTGHRKAAVK